MIIKRSLRGQMPALKRWRTEGGAERGREEAAGSRRKKRRVDNFFPIEMLADIGISTGLPYLPEEFRRNLCVDSPFFPGEAELEAAEALRAVREPAKARLYRPPQIVRTSRGRTLVRPSRFNDSVIIDSCKREKPMSKRLESEFDVRTERPEYRKPSFINPVEANTLQLIREEECYRACRNFSVRRKYSTSLSSLHETFSGLEERFPPLISCTEVPASFNSERASDDRRKDYFVPEDFELGDVVWAKSGKKYPIWPAIVINPMQQAPAMVLHSCIPGALCVMFFGFSGKKRDYGWVKQGMIFPFIDNLDRFQGQTQLYRSKPCDFRMAIDEAFLAENGFFKAEDDERSWAALMENHQSVPRGIHEDTGSNHELEGQSQTQAEDKLWSRCGSCGLTLPIQITKKTKQNAELLVCRHCAKLLRSKQYCGICKKIWHHTDVGSWICCDGCQVWVHAECDRMCSNLKDIENTNYYCPACKQKFNNESAMKRTSEVRNDNNGQIETQPGQVVVVCTGMEGTYFPEQHMILCHCGSCKFQKLTLTEWERHTGCKGKKLEEYSQGQEYDVVTWKMVGSIQCTLCKPCQAPISKSEKTKTACTIARRI